MLRRRLLVAAAVALGCVAMCLWAAPARAAAPAKDGWWTLTNAGLGFTPPSPQVPSGGLYVENGFNGPTAISAVTFQVDPGSQVGTITLQVSGKPVITSPPIACPITTSGLGYKPEQGGPWSDRPAYDCSKSQVTGKVSSGNTDVTFDAGPLLSNGTVAAVLLAGGNADQIAFDPPGPDALAVTPGGEAGGSGAGVPTGEPAAGPVGLDGGGALGTGSAPLGTEPVTLNPATPVAGIPPALANSTPAGASPRSGATVGPAYSKTRAARRATSTSSGSVSSVRKDLAEVIGLAALLIALVAYTEGFGLLGGRIERTVQLQAPASFSSEA